MQTITKNVRMRGTGFTNKSAERNISKKGVVYYPFSTEKETNDWIDNTISKWWDDETI